MAEPLIFSDTYGIKLGRAEDVVKACQKVVDTLEAGPDGFSDRDIDPAA